jgi:hypothetical protein
MEKFVGEKMREERGEDGYLGTGINNIVADDFQEFWQQPCFCKSVTEWAGQRTVLGSAERDEWDGEGTEARIT